MTEFIHGAVTMGCAVIGLFFLKFWKKSHDRLFLFFSAAFWVMGIDWLALSLSDANSPQTAIFVLRLLTFVLILIGIWDKNRSAGRAS